ncbi:MAG: hypothetical protein A3B31_00860 [Candidatus Komeilibacteria bacterium RIFCSPLOWO2_01_FULL_53_11]|uniref:Endolytic murein transglycosylase n=1 Tax=Candidatus Komeilibacteria bacterium RIFCSPLOWO2_01_FULL_53_11 TaxID=1798552 RepID=A0A1G2BWJ8_9BACT|nr:MAG: hypothetical protein A3B31_00860 [Candidatus Komeilibacteria bacterium RIFCSPLOWO2_01_FULL_53_11]
MKRFIFILFVVLLVAVVWAAMQFGPPQTTGTVVQFRIEQGEGVKSVGRRLADAGLIRNRFLFETYLWYLKADTRVKAGTFALSTAADLPTQVDILLSGVDDRARRVTLIEGWTIDEYADRLDESGFEPEIFSALARDLSLWRDSYDVLASVPSGQSIEGYLFPDTYSVDAAKDAEQLIRKMLNNFSAKLTPVLRDQVAGSGRTLHEVITLASIIEREVAEPADRRLVTDIFLKRLRDGIGLQSDATVNYITKSGRARSTAADLEIDSPYNTYKYRGLPPGPIGNPGIDAITAALAPQPNDYYYFLTDADGGVHYARTFDEHQRNRELYL